MTSPFSFDSVTIPGWLSAALLAGVVIRARVPFFQRFLFPSCLLGGIFGFCLIQSGFLEIPRERLEFLAYHLFNISFISMGLTGTGYSPEGGRSVRRILRGSLWMTSVQVASFGFQAAAGGLAVIFFGWLGTTLFPGFGFLVPLGFEEGPGQALSVAKVWEGFGFDHAATIGLTFAATGYFFAFFAGVPMVNRGIRGKPGGQTAVRLPGDIPDGRTVKAGRPPLHTGNIDPMAFHAALAGGVYLATHALIRILSLSLPPDAARIIWGFFFIFGLMVAIITRWAIEKAGAGHLIDPGIQRRITGWAVDFLIVATVMAIRLPVIRAFWGPILAMSLAAGLGTLLLVMYLGSFLRSHSLQRQAAILGTVTGTVSCGLLLLRMSDPDFRTPVAMEIALMNVFSIPAIGLCMLLVNAPVWWRWGVGLTVLVFCGIMAAGMIGAWLLGRSEGGKTAGEPSCGQPGRRPE